MIKRILLALLLLLIGFVAYTLISTGFFREVDNQFDGEVLAEIPLKGAEDITASATDGFALISATDRGVYPPLQQEEGGLHYLPLGGESFQLQYLTADFPQPFAPHGIAMLKLDSTYQVLVINHTEEQQIIEVFTLAGQQLRHERSLTDPAMVSPNDLVIVNDRQFYFTNDHGYTAGFGKFLEEYGGLAASNVVFFDGENYREVADGIAYANGINIDRERQLLYVASPRKFLVKVYQILEDGSLTFIEDIPCGTGVDNIELDKEGHLWIGGHPNLLRFAAYASGKKETSPSEIIRIDYRGEGDYTVEQVFVDDGKLMSSASVASRYRNLILAGNVKDDHFLILKWE